MGATTHAYIIAARITQGHEQWETSTPAERQSIIDNYMKIKDDPLMQKHANHSTADLMKHMHHHNDSESSIDSKVIIPKHDEHKEHHSHAHSLRQHFSHHSHSTSDLAETGVGGGLEHKHSLRSHLPHIHKHDSENGLRDQISHSTPELLEAHKGIPMVHEAEVRQVTTIN